MSHPVRVLIVEDLPDDAELLVRQLRLGALTPLWKQVQSGEELRQALVSEPWEIVLSGYRLRGFGAEAALQVVRSRDPHLPFIVVSGAVGEEHAAALMRDGASDFVLKQNLSRLPSAVGRELRRAEDRRARHRAEAERAGTLRDLEKHVKELTAYRDCASLLRREDLALSELLQKFVDLLAPAWQYPEIAAARVSFAGHVAQTANFRDGPARLSSSFTTAHHQSGAIEVVYLSPPPNSAASPFLAEEQRLIDSMAEMLGSYFDRLETQAALQSSERRYRLLFDSTPHPMWVFERETLRFLDVNAAAVATYGYTREEFLAMTIRDIRPSEDLAVLDAVIAASRPTGDVYTGQVNHRTRDGRILQVEITAHAVELDGRRAAIVLAQDVTERVRSQAESRRTADLLQAVVENTPDAVFVKDLEGRYLLCNQATARFIGRSEKDILGRHDRDLFAADSSAVITTHDQRVLATGQATTEEEHLRVDGIWRAFLATKAPLRDSENNVVGLIGVSRDITEQKQAQEALRVSEQRFRAFMHNTPTLAWLVDVRGRVIFVNRAFHQIIKLPRTSLVGRHVRDIFPPAHADIYLENIRRVADSNEVLEAVEPAFRTDGTTGKFLVYRFPVLNADGSTEIGGIGVDITERKQMEETLRLRDRAIGAATQGILIADAAAEDYPIVYVSPGFERLTGYPSAEVVGRNCRFLQGPDSDPETRARIRQALREETACTAEILNYRKDGTPFWNELSISPVRDADGRLTHFVGVQSDVTDRRRLEQQFLHAQRMEAVGQLAGGVAHDFNNLLTIINGYCEILLEQTSPEDPAWESLEEIRVAGERSANLTRQLLAFSRRQMLALQVLDLNAIVSNTEKMLRRLIGEDVEFITSLADGLPPVKADVGQVEQILVNLVVNARDAMPTGGQLRIATNSVHIDAAHARQHVEASPGSHVVLSVSDTGCGISPAARSRIFEPFFTTKKAGSGTGLGLAVVHGIVNQLNGHIEVASEVGRGTIFHIFFPSRREALERYEEAAEPSTLPRGTERVLLVEDEAGVRALAKRALERCGYTVLEAAHAEAADELVEASPLPIDLLVTDVVMPGESGPQIANRLAKRFPAMRVLFVSGYTDDTIVRHGALRNSVHFLPKPYSALQLARKVREVLDAQQPFDPA